MDFIKNKNAEYDVIGIGSALLDFTVEVDDSILSKINLNKGEMHLVDENRSTEILELLKSYPMEITPGGSSANTVSGILNFGGKSIFCGKVGKDEHGDYYINETKKNGVISRIVKEQNYFTGFAITFITSDSERTFATHLGAALQYNKDDISEDDIKKSRILHLEGYLFEPEGLREACVKAMETAKKNNVLISIDLSDPALISRIYDTFKEVITDYANIIFLNEDEAKEFTGVHGEEALDQLYTMCDFAVVKLGANGSIIKYDGQAHNISVYETEVVNTNGAGDLFAAGALYGIARGFDPERCGMLGSYAASLVVSQVGARINESIDVSKF